MKPLSDATLRFPFEVETLPLGTGLGGKLKITRLDCRVDKFLNHLHGQSSLAEEARSKRVNGLKQRSRPRELGGGARTGRDSARQEVQQK